ncbi:hypothetical protein GCM10009527_005570 [Actinomadura nitritigenes]|uniref:DUF6879 domain-containing protein n=1 Tax=Actinomadura nitritigenes TaxID=134602 RepID=A0ABS3REJ0_9ACTN|nr:DUF6879 family protein [Actinomadura nitritigenes]MBO2444655.1 hypothetical protein [Actinomadura nitritigenes]
MLDQIPTIPGDALDHAAYHRDFARQIEDLTGVVWKLERSQTFRELNDPSWQAFAAGDWQRSLRLLEKDREAVRGEARHNKRQGLSVRRVRVVEYPVSPYLQWELYALRMLAEEGFELSVLQADELSSLETRGQLPEVVVIGKRVLYEVQYLPDWTPCGARCIRAPHIVRTAASEIADLYSRGEPLLDFFEREVAPLPAPAV